MSISGFQVVWKVSPPALCFFSQLTSDPNLMYAFQKVPGFRSAYCIGLAEDTYIIGCSGMDEHQTLWELRCQGEVNAAKQQAEELAEAIERAEIEGL